MSIIIKTVEEEKQGRVMSAQSDVKWIAEDPRRRGSKPGSVGGGVAGSRVMIQQRA